MSWFPIGNQFEMVVARGLKIHGISTLVGTVGTLHRRCSFKLSFGGSEGKIWNTPQQIITEGFALLCR